LRAEQSASKNKFSLFLSLHSGQIQRWEPLISLADPNPVNPKHPKRIAIVVSNPAISTTTGWPVGFWWSELVHPYLAFTEAGYEVEIFSPAGGRVEADAMSDPRDPSGYSASDLASLGFINTPALMARLETTGKAADIALERFDAIVVAGGQAPMFTFADAHDLHRIFVAFMRRGRLPPPSAMASPYCAMRACQKVRRLRKAKR
jgi:hypothetical protein